MIADQRADVTLEKVRKESSKMESDCYFFTNDLLMHPKHLPEERNGIRYVDRIVVPLSEQGFLSKGSYFRGAKSLI